MKEEKMYIHFVNHEKKGTMYNLIYPITLKNNNHLMLDFTSDVQKILEKINSINGEKVLIIHTSGSKKFALEKKLLNKLVNVRVVLFLHVSLNFLETKSRKEDFLKLMNINKEIKVLVLSQELIKEFEKYKINVKVVEPGIKEINYDDAVLYKKELEKYYNKIITTCTSSEEKYQYIKGIDIFDEIIKKTKNNNFVLIAGSILENDNRFMKFSHKDFLNVLYHSIAYIQCSRHESYNITAVEAKQLKVPTFILKAEGNLTCMNKTICINKEDIIKKINKIFKNGEKIENDEINQEIELNYLESIERENLNNFIYNIEKEV